MGRSVRELLATLSASEINEFKAYNLIQPIGDERGELQAGLVASAIANVNGNKTTPLDFMVFSKEQKKAEDDADKRSQAIAKGLGVSIEHR